MNTNLVILTTLALSAVALSGCTSSDAGSDSMGNACPDDIEVVTLGSSTVKPLAEVWAEQVLSLECPLDVSVSGGGSSKGASDFCADFVDIGHMSRDLRDSDRAKCADSGRSLVQWKIALDALSVVVQKNDANAAIADLTTDELFTIFGENGAQNWNDVRAGFPDAQITLCYPDDASGTFGYFQEEIMETGDDQVEPFKSGGRHQQSANDEDLVNCLEGDEYAIGFFGFSYYDASRSTMRAIAIENEDGDFVKPEIETVADGSYNPLGRYLYMLTEQAPKESVMHYLEYILDEGQAPSVVERAGFISLDAPTLNAMRNQYAALG